MFRYFLLLSAIALFATNPAISQDQRDLLDPKTRDIINRALDGEKAKEHVLEIVKYHRVQGSREYRKAANYVLDRLRSYGFSEKDAYIESFKSDGRTLYQTWQSPSGWDITSAELSMVEPEPEIIASYPQVPLSVMTYSNPGDVTAELVWAGTGTSEGDYKGKDVKGKIVLATGYGGDVHRLAVLKYGAKAVVCYLADGRVKEHPDMVGYSGIWPRQEELDKVKFGFNISNRQGEKLKNMLLGGGKKVVLRGWVKGTGLEPFFMDVVVAHIRGTQKPDMELICSAHLDHPKQCANDNASGSAAMLDMARAFKSLTDSSKLPLPKRSLRLLWVPEWNGTMAYIDAHPEIAGPEIGGGFLAGINLDMVGENLEMLHSKMYITRTPESVSSCLGDVVENMAGMVDKMNIRTPNGSKSEFNYRVVKYSDGSDHMMFIDRKIPSVMLGHSDYTHHTSEDTPDKVDPTELQRSEMIASGTLWYLANLNGPEGLDLLELIRSNAGQRLGEISRLIKPYLDGLSPERLPLAWAEMEYMINSGMIRETNAANSVTYFNSAPEIKDLASALRPHFGRRFEYLYGQARLTVEANGHASDTPPLIPENPDARVPVRLSRGPLDFGLPESKLPPKEAGWYKSKEFPLDGDERFELVNFIDGKRTVSEIWIALIGEFSAFPHDAVQRYISDLVKTGVVKWK